MDLDSSKWPGGEVPGWTARGHAGYSGYAWYRLKVDVEGAKRSLALKMPSSADDAYQVFVNGDMVGEFGKFTEQRSHRVRQRPSLLPGPQGGAERPYDNRRPHVDG